MTKPSITRKAGRHFLTDRIREEVEWRDTPQSRGVKPPPVQKPVPDGAALYPLPGRENWHISPCDLAEAISRRESRRRFLSAPLTLDELRGLRRQGVRIFAPPMPALLDLDSNNRIVPSQYALDIKRAGFKIITWTFERSDLRKGASQGGFYYYFDPEGKAIKKDSDMYKALDVLARQVRILGIFSDWPATVTYYANCMGLD